MLGITRRELGRTVTLVVEGRLSGPWVRELERCWEEADAGARDLVVDVDGVLFIDAAGKALLDRMCRGGVRLEAETIVARGVLDALALLEG